MSTGHGGAMVLGADVEGLDGVAAHCKQGAEIAGEVVAVLEAICAASFIFGPFAASFITYLQTVVIPWVKAVQEALTRFASALTGQAADQRSTSGALTGGPGGMSYRTPANLPTGNTRDYPLLGAPTASALTAGTTTADGSVPTPGGTDSLSSLLFPPSKPFDPLAPLGLGLGGPQLQDSGTGGPLLGPGPVLDGRVPGGFGAPLGPVQHGAPLGPVQHGAPPVIGAEHAGGDHAGGEPGGSEYPENKGLPHALEHGFGTGSSNPEHAGTTYGSVSEGGLTRGTPVTLGTPLAALPDNAAVLSGTVLGGPGTGMPAVDGKLLYAEGNIAGGGVFGAKSGAALALGGSLALGVAQLKSKQSGVLGSAGDVPFTLRAEEKAAVEAKVEGNARLGGTWDHGKLVIGGEAKGEAFAGARATGDVSLAYGDYARGGVELQAQYGVGANGSAQALYSDGHLRFGMGAAVALGPGAGIKPYVDINVAKIGADLITAGRTSSVPAAVTSTLTGIWP